MLHREERDTWRVSLPSARTAEIQALSPSTPLLSALTEKFPLFYLTVTSRIFLSAIQAGNQLIDTRRTFSVGVDWKELRQE